MKLQDYKHVHCIGIGGIGLSAIARYCHSQGARVTGSDSGVWPVTLALREEGIIVHEDYNVSYVEEGTTLVIYTIATKPNNPELNAVKKRGIKCLSYPEALGMLTEEYTTIAVCGTHGKTTTTAMVANMLKACGKNPTVIVGSLLAEGGTNFVQGGSEYLVVEACEYKRSFLNLHPTHVLVTNIDEDHLDYYKDMDDIKSAFQSFASTIPSHGGLITHADVSLDTVAQKVNADTVLKETIELSVLGDHNKSNAQLALALARTLALNDEDARKGLLSFRGTWRRLEYKGIWHDVALYDDYGHHPTEIKATLAALRQKYTKDEYDVTAVFQPHLFSRTKLLLNDFAQSFEDATHVYVLPIYKAREVDDGTISSEHLVEKMSHAENVSDFNVLQEKLELLTTNPKKQVFITIGAGDVYRFYDSLPVVH